ncbi:MAG: serpin family protein [Bacteroidales bacterium]|nr:serpin family protein [Bacteroidales bacterium]
MKREWIYPLIGGVIMTSSSCEEKEEMGSKIPSQWREIGEVVEPSRIELSKEEAVVNDAALKFSLRFMKQALKDKGNIFLSPLSAQIALSMALNGAEGNTQEEMLAVLGYEGLTMEEMNSYNKVMIAALEGMDKTTKVEIANSMWADKSFSFKKEYVEQNKKTFDAETRTLDFLDKSSAEVVNGWCSEKTHGCINKVVEDLSALRSMLINALYFKGMWSDPFEKSNTKDETFTNVDGTSQKVAMMKDFEKHYYGETDKVKTVELPYGNKSYSMVLAMPKDGVSFGEAVEEMTENWSGVNRSMRKKEVDLWLPKFELSYNRSLTDDLKALGMKDAFQASKAKFGKMSDEELYIGNVNQVTFIKVDEEGTEAAAVTVIEMTCTALPEIEEPAKFHADKPFVYAIKENSTGAILFMGKMESMKK